MCASATLTMLASMAPMRAPRSTAKKTAHLLASRAPSPSCAAPAPVTFTDIAGSSPADGLSPGLLALDDREGPQARHATRQARSIACPDDVGDVLVGFRGFLRQQLAAVRADEDPPLGEGVHQVDPPEQALGLPPAPHPPRPVRRGSKRLRHGHRGPHQDVGVPAHVSRNEDGMAHGLVLGGDIGMPRVAPFRWTHTRIRSPSTTCSSIFAMLWATSYTMSSPSDSALRRSTCSKVSRTQWVITWRFAKA